MLSISQIKISLSVHSAHQLMKLQTVPNAATRFITNHSLLDRLANEKLHKMTDLKNANVFLHRQANNIWTNIGDKVDGETIVNFISDKDRPYTCNDL